MQMRTSANYQIPSTASSTQNYVFHRPTPGVKPSPKGEVFGFDFSKCAEIVSGRFYFIPFSGRLPITNDAHFFSMDYELRYDPFFADFGPFHIGCTKRYIDKVDALLREPSLRNKRIVHFCSRDDKRLTTNAAVLIAAYAICRLGMDANSASALVSPFSSGFIPFHDASPFPNTFNLTVPDMISGFKKAVTLGWFHPDRFDLRDYEHYERVENGDWNWIIPGKFLAFSGPNGQLTHFPPEMFVAPFRRMGVTTVIRLNKRCYERSAFVKGGIEHHDLIYPDGTNPSDVILQKFMTITSNPSCVAAVHCKAGLGRTGTLIGAYMMQHYGFTAKEAISWLRLCRPGSVIGPQQQYLQEKESEFWRIYLNNQSKQLHQNQQSLNSPSPRPQPQQPSQQQQQFLINSVSGLPRLQSVDSPRIRNDDALASVVVGGRQSRSLSGAARSPTSPRVPGLREPEMSRDVSLPPSTRLPDSRPGTTPPNGYGYAPPLMASQLPSTPTGRSRNRGATLGNSSRPSEQDRPLAQSLGNFSQASLSALAGPNPRSMMLGSCYRGAAMAQQKQQQLAAVQGRA